MLLLLGILWLILWRWGHDRGLLIFGAKSVWPSAPGWVRRVARGRPGEVNALALANEVWALAVTGYGLVLSLTPPQDAASSGLTFARVIITLLVPILFAGAYAIWRSWKEPS